MSYPSEGIDITSTVDTLHVRIHDKQHRIDIALNTNEYGFSSAMRKLGWTRPNEVPQHNNRFVIGNITAYPMTGSFIANLSNGFGVRFDINDKALIEALRDLGWSPTPKVDSNLVMKLVECKGDALAIRSTLQEWLT